MQQEINTKASAAKTAQRTPGPWVADEPSENGSIAIRDKANGWMICRVNPTDDAECEDHGNARLIATSPELLLALQNIVEEMSGIISVAQMDGETHRMPSLCAVRDIARNAINSL